MNERNSLKSRLLRVLGLTMIGAILQVAFVVSIFGADTAPGKEAKSEKKTEKKPDKKKLAGGGAQHRFYQLGHARVRVGRLWQRGWRRWQHHQRRHDQGDQVRGPFSSWRIISSEKKGVV